MKKRKENYLIYRITNTENNKSYIGKTVKGIRSRWSDHKSEARKCKGYHNHFHNAIRKYDEGVWSLDVLYVSFTKDDKHLYDVETQLITEYNTYKAGYNSTTGGEGFVSGEDHPLYGVKLSPERVAAMSERLKGNTYTLGHKATEEQTKARSKAMMGVQRALGSKRNLEQLANNKISLQKQKVRTTNTSGITGVTWDTPRGRWKARIHIDSYQEKHLGRFKLKNDAIIARLMAELKYWGQIRIYDY